MKASLAIIFTIMLSASACATPTQMYWDHKVKELCEKDGGVTVFERVVLTPEEYRRNNGRNGSIRVPPEKSPLANNFDYLYRISKSEINHSNPEVWRTENTFYRKADGKILGKSVNYTRSGGDLLEGVAHQSHFSCRDIGDIQWDIENKIFSVMP